MRSARVLADAMAPIPPSRVAVRTIPFVLVVAAALGSLVWLNGEFLPALAATAAVVVVMTPAIAQAPARLAWRLEEFAVQVPGEPEASLAWHGEQTLEWPDLELVVEGQFHRYRLQDFVVHADGTTRFLSSSRPREAARHALEELDVDPALEDDRDRLPSFYPRIAGVKTGLLAAFLAAISVGLGSPLVAGGVYPQWWWALVPIVGVAVGGARWLGLAHARRAYATLLEELRYGSGLEVETLDRTGGRVRIDVVVHTGGGSVSTTCVAIPWGRLTAQRPNSPEDTVSSRLPDPAPVPDRIGPWLR
jgi:hypothetical protein